MFQHHETTLAVNPEMIQRITEMEKVEFGTRLPDEKNDNFQNSIMYYTD
ncbi:hypothetical protein ACN9MH_05155 [Paenibacillus silvae]|nr:MULTISPECIES: hypothetical protein [Paenibacillus]